jgi:hypothetical protein
VWYVALPVFDKPVAAKRSCEVVILESGSPACVREPGRARADLKKPKPANRATQPAS